METNFKRKGKSIVFSSHLKQVCHHLKPLLFKKKQKKQKTYFHHMDTKIPIGVLFEGTALETDWDLEEQEPRAKDKEVKGEKSHRPNKGPTQGTIHKNMPKKPWVGSKT